MKVSELAKKLNSFNIGLFQEISVENKSDELADLNKGQLLQGLTSKGQKVRPKYKGERYSKKKATMNSLPGAGTPDMKLTGDFHAGMITITDKKQYHITSEDFKIQFLPDTYPDILGLNKKSIAKARVVVTNEFIKLFKKYIE